MKPEVETVDYIPQTPAQAAPQRMAYHADEMCRLISCYADGRLEFDQRKLAVAKLKLEDAIVWLQSIGLMSVQRN